MEEYLYQKLGYKEIAKKFMTMDVEDMMKKEVRDVTTLRFENVTQEMIEEFIKLKKTNREYGSGFVKNFVFLLVICIVFSCIAIFADYSIKHPIEHIKMIPFVVVILLVIFGVIYCGKKRKLKHPVGFNWGYIVATARRLSEKEHNKEYATNATFLDIWFEKEDRFLLNVEQGRYEIEYAGEKYCWSDLVYTPIKIFLFADGSIEIMPAYLDK